MHGDDRPEQSLNHALRTFSVGRLAARIPTCSDELRGTADRLFGDLQLSQEFADASGEQRPYVVVFDLLPRFIVVVQRERPEW